MSRIAKRHRQPIEPRVFESQEAVRQLWSNLILCCQQAGQDGLDTDDFGYVLLELGVGSLGLGFEKDFELEEYVYHLCQSVKQDGSALVNSARMFRAKGKIQPHLVSGGSVLDTYDRPGHVGEWRALLPVIARLAPYRPDFGQATGEYGPRSSRP